MFLLCYYANVSLRTLYYLLSQQHSQNILKMLQLKRNILVKKYVSLAKVLRTFPALTLSHSIENEKKKVKV